MKNIVAIYKPKGPTSHDIINEIRRITGEKRVGHAGTLDPLASGVLVVGIGREATRELSKIVAKEKEYVARVRLGETSETDDAEGRKTAVAGAKKPLSAEMEAVLEKFRGKIMQKPPAYSALKLQGESAYKKARRGEVLALEPREAEIKEIELLKYEWPFLEMRVVTGPGVYIRALARDIGETLGTGAYLAELERVRVGEFTKENALSPDDLLKTIR